MPDRRYISYFRLNEDNPFSPYLYIIPFLILFSTFLAYPIFQGFYISLCKWDFLDPEKKFIGFKNYINLFKEDILFWPSLKNTFIFVIESVPLMIMTSLLLAWALNEKLHGRTIFRMGIVMPMVVNVAAVGLVWSWIVDPQVGLLNYYLEKIGLEPQSWVVQEGKAMWLIVLVSLWWGVGFNTILFLAGLQDIPEQLYEAAKIDGATSLKSFIHITLPCLRPTLLFVCVMQIIGAFQIFGQVYMITGGGPYNSTRVLVQHLYETGFEWFKMGLAASMAWVLFVVIMVFSLLQFKLFQSEAQY